MHCINIQKRGHRWFGWLLGLFLIWVCIPAWAADSQLAAKLDLPDNFKLCREVVPVQFQEVRERFEKEMLLSLWDRPQVLLWLKRAPRYLPYIAQELNAQKMPDDLKYLAVAESAL